MSAACCPPRNAARAPLRHAQSCDGLHKQHAARLDCLSVCEARAGRASHGGGFLCISNGDSTVLSWQPGLKALFLLSRHISPLPLGASWPPRFRNGCPRHHVQQRQYPAGRKAGQRLKVAGKPNWMVRQRAASILYRDAIRRVYRYAVPFRERWRPQQRTSLLSTDVIHTVQS